MLGTELNTRFLFTSLGAPSHLLLSRLQAGPSSIAMTWTPRSILSPPMASHPSMGISGLDLPRVLHLCIQLLSLQGSMDQKKNFFLIKPYYFRPLIMQKFIFLPLFIYFANCAVCGVWVLRPEIKLMPLAVKAQRLNHCTAREFAAIYFLEQLVLS